MDVMAAAKVLTEASNLGPDGGVRLVPRAVAEGAAPSQERRAGGDSWVDYGDGARGEYSTPPSLYRGGTGERG
jgi:hypothetical protein